MEKINIPTSTILTSYYLGQEIYKARKAKGMTQEELGKILGVTPQNINKYEKGRISNIPLAIRQKISEILNIKIDDLLTPEEKAAAARYNEISENNDEKIILYKKNFTEDNWRQLLQIVQIMSKAIKPPKEE